MMEVQVGIQIAVLDASEAVITLKALFADVLVDDQVDEEARAIKVTVLMKMLRARGTAVSASVERMFSEVVNSKKFDS